MKATNDGKFVAAALASGARDVVGRTIDPSRLRRAAVVAAVVLGGLSLAGSFVDGHTGAVTYVAAVGFPALVALMVATRAGSTARAWRLIGVGISLWAVTGFVVTLEAEAGLERLPDVVSSIGYVVGYLPVLLGLAELGEVADPRGRARRWSCLVDCALVFLVLYGVLWLLVVEAVAYDSELAVVDRAFSSMYPAGDIAMVMLSVRIAARRVTRTRVAVLLVVASLLCTVADTLLMVLYLVNPDGSYPVTDLLYTAGLSLLALAALWSLLPAPAPSSLGSRWAAARSAPVIVTATTMLPAVVLLGVVAFTDRRVAVVPVAVWLAALTLALALRSLSGMRALEDAHRQTRWMATHDQSTGALLRAAFTSEMSEGSPRNRSGTVFVLELQGSAALADEHGLDVADAVRDAVMVRLRRAVGPDAVLGRLSSDRVAAFTRASDLGRARQVAKVLETAFSEPLVLGDHVVRWSVCGGVAQADGAVIDATAGIRRATEAMSLARGRRPGVLLFDADLPGRVEPLVSGTAGRAGREAASTTTVS